VECLKIRIVWKHEATGGTQPNSPFYFGDFVNCTGGAIGWNQQSPPTSQISCQESTSDSVTVGGDFYLAEELVTLSGWATTFGFNINWSGTQGTTNGISFSCGDPKPDSIAYCQLGIEYNLWKFGLQEKNCYPGGCSKWSKTHTVRVQHHLFMAAHIAWVCGGGTAPSCSNGGGPPPPPPGGGGPKCNLAGLNGLEPDCRE
jgi:hypothetical protein